MDNLKRASNTEKSHLRAHVISNECYGCERTGTKLLPFIKVMRSPDKKALACFIYNRLDGADQGAKWVSYHFDQESEILHSASELTSTLDSLRQ